MKRWTAGGALLARKSKLFIIAPVSCEGFTLALSSPRFPPCHFCLVNLKQKRKSAIALFHAWQLSSWEDAATKRVVLLTGKWVRLGGEMMRVAIAGVNTILNVEDLLVTSVVYIWKLYFVAQKWHKSHEAKIFLIKSLQTFFKLFYYIYCISNLRNWRRRFSHVIYLLGMAQECDALAINMFQRGRRFFEPWDHENILRSEIELERDLEELSCDNDSLLVY